MRQIFLFEQLAVPLGMICAARCPGVKVAEFDAQNRRLQCVQPAIYALNFVKIFCFAAVDANHSQALGHLGSLVVISPPSPAAPRFFGRKETETAKIA